MPAGGTGAAGGAIDGADGRPVEVTGPDGRQISVTGRGLLTAPPAAVDGMPVLSWAGPWLLDERWWAGGGSVTAPAVRQARMQVVTDGGSPMLLGFGVTGWRVEAVYD